MDRLQKKCIVASASAHLLLAGVLFIGPAFLASSPKVPEIQMIDFIPDRIVEGAMAGGGNPLARRPPVIQPEEIKPPQPVSQPVARPQPEVKPEVKPEPKPPPEPVKPRVPERIAEVKNNQPDPDNFDQRKETSPHKPMISTELKTRPKTSSKTTSKANSDSESDTTAERRANENRRRLAGEIARMAGTLKSGTAPAVTVEGNYGPGGGGETYAGYDSLVQSIYFNAWVPSEDIANDRAITWATIVIDRDGTVLTARITTASGDANMEKSVQRTLEKVKFISPFPEGAKEKQRTYKIKFDLTAKRLS